MNMQAQIVAQYVNPRAGNHPPTIKDQTGTSYTLSDPAYQIMAGQVGQQGNIGYYTNQKGYHVATHWNGVELPKGQWPSQAPVQQQSLPPLAAPQMATPQTALPAQSNDKGMDIFLTGVVQQAMSTGKFGPTDIKVLALAARDAWNEAHQPSVGQQSAMPDGRPAAPLPDDPDAFLP